MGSIKGKAKKVVTKSYEIAKADGMVGLAKRSAKYAYYRQYPERRKQHFKDVLFINGCTLPHPERFRVHHQMEQLQSNGMTTSAVFYDQLNLDMLKYYRAFVFFRCPVTDTVREFIKQANHFNKACFFDIDDLVIDQKYTDRIPYVRSMGAGDKSLYDDGVNRMRETLSLCDYAITTTTVLQRELKQYAPEVYVNRNVVSDEMISHSIAALKDVQKSSERVVIGYFSGSITHNSDFEMVLPSLIKILQKHKNVYLKIAGILDIPADLKPFKDRLLQVEFMDWRKMPLEMAECDINIAPLTQSIFNEAKSENKWLEAALVKVVTVASDLGAFKEVIKHDNTGVLVKSQSDWFPALDDLVTDTERRQKIAGQAHDEVLESYSTLHTGMALVTYIKSKLAKNIAFVLPSTDISGGVNVVMKHVDILRRNGYDPTIISMEPKKQDHPRRVIEGVNVLVAHNTVFDGYFDTLVATLWSTMRFIKKYPNVRKRSYFVQNFETDFSPYGSVNRLEANATYNEPIDIEYLTMSRWCQQWLKDRYGKSARYASNGLELSQYKGKKRIFTASKKIKILIEGDSLDHYKNVDEAFKVVNLLDPKRYEIAYLSYRSAPKKWYRVDTFYNRIAPEEVGKVYASCDILIKSSLVESFSYPPLEMMATGGFAVVVPNGGNVEYLVDQKNCLFYKQGDIEDAAEAIERISSNKNLRDTLYKGGQQTAAAYDWSAQEASILKLYK